MKKKEEKGKTADFAGNGTPKSASAQSAAQKALSKPISGASEQKKKEDAREFLRRKIREAKQRRLEAEQAAREGQKHPQMEGESISTLAGRLREMRAKKEEKPLPEEKRAPEKLGTFDAYQSGADEKTKEKRESALQKLDSLEPPEEIERRKAEAKKALEAIEYHGEAPEQAAAEEEEKPEKPKPAPVQKPKEEKKEPTIDVTKPPPALQSFLESAHEAYGQIPPLPYIDRSVSVGLYVAFALYAAFAISFFIDANPGFLPELIEGPLSKNAQLSILPGERYLYTLSSGGTEQTVVYETRSSPSCEGVVVVESNSQNMLCISRDGDLLNSNIVPTNSSFGDMTILLFAPWMLAASENFNWVVETRISSGDVNLQFPIHFQSLGSAEIAGRNAYEVVVSSDFEQPSTYYIDKDKRVLIFVKFGESSSAKLVRAPFEVNWTRETKAYLN